MSKMFEALDQLEEKPVDFPTRFLTEPRAIIREPASDSDVPAPVADKKTHVSVSTQAALVMHSDPREARSSRIVAEIFDASMVLVGLVLFLGIFFFSGGAAMLMKQPIFLVPVLIVLIVFYRFLWVLANHDTPGMRLARLGMIPLDVLSASKEPRSVRQVVVQTMMPLMVSRPTGPAIRLLIEELVLANRILASEGVVDAYGQVSVRDDRNRERYLLARQPSAGPVTAADIIEYDLDSKPVMGDSAGATEERFLHGAIYKARPDVMAIVRCEAPELIVFGASTVPLLPISHTAAFLRDGVPVLDLHAADGGTDMLIETPAQGRALAQALGDKPVALLRGHGAVVVAESLHAVVGRAYYLTVNARLQQQAIQLGGQVTYIKADEARQAAPPDGFERAWEFLKQKVAT